MQPVTVSEMLTIMETGRAFTAAWVRFDERRPASNGELLPLQLWDGHSPLQEQSCVLASRLDAFYGIESARRESTSRPAVRPETFVRTVYRLSGGVPVGDPIAIHPRCVLVFNGCEVTD
jgi:hypothetical protein